MSWTRKDSFLLVLSLSDRWYYSWVRLSQKWSKYLRPTLFLCNSRRRHIVNFKHSNHIANASKCQLDYASAKRLKLNPLKSCIIYIPSKGHRRKAATENIFLLGRKIRLSISHIAYRYHRRKHVRRGDNH